MSQMGEEWWLLNLSFSVRAHPNPLGPASSDSPIHSLVSLGPGPNRWSSGGKRALMGCFFFPKQSEDQLQMSNIFTVNFATASKPQEFGV